MHGFVYNPFCFAAVAAVKGHAGVGEVVLTDVVQQKRINHRTGVVVVFLKGLPCGGEPAGLCGGVGGFSSQGALAALLPVDVQLWPGVCSVQAPG